MTSKKSQPSSNRKQAALSKKETVSPSRKGQVLSRDEAIYEELKKAGEPAITIRGIIEAYSGPLPHPKILEEYKKTDPKLVSEIRKQFSLNQDHKRLMDKRLDNRFFVIRIVEILGMFLLIGYVSYILQDTVITISVIVFASLTYFRKQIAKWLDRLLRKDSSDE